MKKIINLLLIVFLGVVVMEACVKNNSEYMYNEKPSIYFYQSAVGQETPADSTTYSYFIKPDSVKDYVIPIIVRITGVAVNYDRKFNVQVATGTTAVQGTNFTIAPGIIPAGKYDGRLNVTLKRTTDLKTNLYVINLTMVASDDFKTGYDSKLKYKINFTEMPIKPSPWLTSYIGDYSVGKLMFMYQILGFNIDWNGQPPYFYAISALLRTELAKYEKVNGPLIDAATGVRVAFPG